MFFRRAIGKLGGCESWERKYGVREFFRAAHTREGVSFEKWGAWIVWSLHFTVFGLPSSLDLILRERQLGEYVPHVVAYTYSIRARPLFRAKAVAYYSKARLAPYLFQYYQEKRSCARVLIATTTSEGYTAPNLLHFESAAGV